MLYEVITRFRYIVGPLKQLAGESASIIVAIEQVFEPLELVQNDEIGLKRLHTGTCKNRS